MAAMEAIHQQEELWKQVFLVWTTEGELELLSEYRWSFSNLDRVAYYMGRQSTSSLLQSVLVMGDGWKLTDIPASFAAQLLRFGDGWKLTDIPAVIAVVSPFPPSDKIGIALYTNGV
ncbi:unnamed protein product [Lactuca saligna]|uniref:Uncharacterized protein n=1 Tax=Lactuca saligna TaxID=75948 RepID=A0AA36EDT7_LACSI|nr:unnamed protein product [Lactuca saligna]